MIDLEALACVRAAEQMEAFRWNEERPKADCACGRPARFTRRGLPRCHACQEKERRART